MTSAAASSSCQSSRASTRSPTRRRRRAGIAGEQTDARRRVLGLGREAGERLAIRIERGDVEHRDARRRPGPAALRPRRAPVLELAQHPLQAEAVTAFDAEAPAPARAR